MKLTARKTMVALGTAAALSLTGVSAPAMAADKPAATQKAETKQGDPAYSRIYSSVSSTYKYVLTEKNKLDGALKTRKVEVGDDSDALSKLDEASSTLDRVQRVLNNAKASLALIPATGYTKDADYGTLQDLDSQLRNASTDLNDAAKNIRSAKPFSCTAADATGKTDDSGSSSFLDFGSLFKSLGSTGQRVVVNDGKKKCVTNVEYYSDKLKSIVSILTVLFTVITTVSKISETLQKQAMPRR